jgi:lambda family phage portal protein
MLWALPTLKSMGSAFAAVVRRKPDRKALRARAAMAQYQKLRARYDAAQTTAENAEHWAQADDLSARAANSLSVRRDLRRRSRYETANNSYAAGMLLTLSNDTVGTGPRLQMQTEDEAGNQQVQREFAAWAREVGLASKLRTAVLTKARDGEVFIKLRTNSKHHTPVQLDLEVMEGDQVTTPALVPADDHIDGIRFDSEGNVTFYEVLDRHPGDDVPLKDYTPKPIPAALIMHWFRTDRPGQLRGVPEITPALPLYAQLRRFTLAVITAAETAADHAAILQAGSSVGADDVDELQPFDEVQYSRGMLTAVPFGWQLAQMRSEHPTTTYQMFKGEILNEIARCLNMPFNVAAGNSSGYNYSSGRLDHQIYWKSIAITQGDCENVILDRVFRAWYGEARLITRADGTPLVPTIDLSYRPWVWAWDPAEDIDPNKTANARLTDLQTGATTYQDIYGEKGQDWETQQLAQAKALGVTLDQYRALLRQKLFGAALAGAAPPDMQSRRKRRKSFRSIFKGLGA